MRAGGRPRAARAEHTRDTEGEGHPHQQAAHSRQVMPNISIGYLFAFGTSFIKVNGYPEDEGSDETLFHCISLFIECVFFVY